MFHPEALGQQLAEAARGVSSRHGTGKSQVFRMGHVGVIQAGYAGTKPSDAELVSAVRAGDDAAFERLYRRYERRIRGFVQRRVGDAARSEDLTQETFLSALKHLRSSDARIQFKPWLFEIARNAAIDAHRRSSRAEEVPMHDSARLRPLDQRRLVGGQAPEAELAAKERLDHLGGAFDELPPHHHRALVMRELEGLSYREIGERMELTRPAVESTLFRARRRLEHEYRELAAGRRCESARTTIGLIAEGVEVGAERRRLARHARRCSACRRSARELGVEPLPRLAGLRKRVAALLPLPWLLGRPGNGGQDGLRLGAGAETANGHAGALLLGPGAQVGAALAERVAALLAAAALAGAGGAALSVGESASPAAGGSQPAGLETQPPGGAPAGNANPLRPPPARGTRGRALPAGEREAGNGPAGPAGREPTPPGSPFGAGRDAGGSSTAPGAPALPGLPGLGGGDGAPTAPDAGGTTGLSAPDALLPESPAAAAPALPRLAAPAGDELLGQLQQLTAQARS